MSEQEAVAYIEEWDVTEAAKVLKWYEEDELLRPCDCDTIVAIETENLQAENAKLRELVRVMAYCMQCKRECDGCAMNGADGTITAPVGCDGLRDIMRELGVEVE